MDYLIFLILCLLSLYIYHEIIVLGWEYFFLIILVLSNRATFLHSSKKVKNRFTKILGPRLKVSNILRLVWFAKMCALLKVLEKSPPMVFSFISSLETKVTILS